MNTFQRNLVVCRSSASLTTANQTFDSKNIAGIHVAFFLAQQELLDFRIFVLNGFILVLIEQLVETVYEMHETYNFFIAYSNVS